VDWLEAWHVPRPAGIALVLSGTLGIVGLFLVLVLPGIATDVAGVIRELPTQLAALWTTMAPWLEQRGMAVPYDQNIQTHYSSIGYASIMIHASP
jgi:predicted PurR-regulated permease PerM